MSWRTIKAAGKGGVACVWSPLRVAKRRTRSEHIANLVFLGHIDGTFSAYDARTLKELWSFNAGTGINAPPVTYAVNGKQYVAVLAGSRQPNNIIALAPELKNTSPASMLYVFGP